jgi:hypothetical protein
LKFKKYKIEAPYCPVSIEMDLDEVVLFDRSSLKRKARRFFSKKDSPPSRVTIPFQGPGNIFFSVAFTNPSLFWIPRAHHTTSRSESISNLSLKRGEWGRGMML